MGNTACWAVDAGSTATVVMIPADQSERGKSSTDCAEPLEPKLGAAVPSEKAVLSVLMPPAANLELVIMMERELGHNIGLSLDALDGMAAFVDDITFGAVRFWNNSNPPHMHLKVHDRIVGVNNIRGQPIKLLNELKTSTTWVLTVQRPILIHVVLTFGRPLGLDLKYAPQGRTLLICDIGEGAIKEWNEGPREFKVQRNDRILMINGNMGVAPWLLELPANSSTLVLSILHFE